MKDNREIVKNEAIRRLQVLTAKYKLNPNILSSFKDDKVYYSYLTGGGILGSIDTISYDSRYEKAVRDFESKHKGCVVYHAIESETACGDMLSLLFVGNRPEEWETERLSGNHIFAYVVNLTHPQLSEYGDITVSGYGNSGVLIRIG